MIVNRILVCSALAFLSGAAYSNSRWIPVICKEAFPEYAEHFASHLYAHWAFEAQTSSMSCTVQIELAEDGFVEDLTFIDCAKDELLRESVRRAVSEASPLPVPEKKDCFESDIVFTFEYPRG